MNQEKSNLEKIRDLLDVLSLHEVMVEVQAKYPTIDFTVYLNVGYKEGLRLTK